jgi:UDP-N-acetylmuramoyl-tripeptide--D-alanyl-D-alanine ligase
MRGSLDPRAWQGVLEGFNAQIADDARAATAITFDSREVSVTTAFAALQGETRHGNDFIAAALEAGAPFVLTDQDVPRAVKVSDATAALRGWARAWRDLSGATLIGVTGSAGKTTAKEFVAAAIQAGKTPGNLNTLNYLACYLLSEVAPGSRHVIEMGIDRIGEMDELTELVAPDIGVITNVGPAHLEFFGSLETIAFEKGRILVAPEQLVSSTVSWRYPGVPSYGFGEGATHRGAHLELTDSSARFQFAGLEVEIASPSEKVAEAAVLALAIAERFHVPLEDAVKRLKTLEVPGGRMRLERGRYTLIDDTYNANPLSVTAALETLARQPGRKIAVLGDMRELGNDAATYHREIGASAARAAQLLIAVGHHAGDYASGARARNLETLEFADTSTATEALLQHLEDHDTILIKGSKAVGLAAVAEVIRERL